MTASIATPSRSAAQPLPGTLVIEARRIAKTYAEGGLRAEVLTDVDLNVATGERIAIVGASGSGKSTLLHLLGGLDVPSGGEVHVTGQRMSALSEAARGRLRNRALGFVYQFHHLLPEFTAVDNVALPLVIRGVAPRSAQQQATELLSAAGLSHRLRHKPGELSGGERQRAAVARALITRPQCVLADEPTGNLDYKTAQTVFDLMLNLNAEQGTSLIVVTHDPAIAGRLDQRYRLIDGRLLKE